MTDFSQLLVALLLMHVVCEFYLQPAKWEKSKRERKYQSVELYYYSIMHSIAVVLPVLLLNISWVPALYLALAVMAGHFIIELWKNTGTDDKRLSYLIISQGLYLLGYVVITCFLTAETRFEAVLEHEKFWHVVLIIFAYLLIFKPASLLIGSVLRKHSISAPDANSNDDGLTSGGELIGYLERTLILTFTLVGSYAAVGFVLAAKSIFRFGELNRADDRRMTEYVLVGSLLSVVITTIVGALISLWLGISIN
ncbi:DUF3307 domain-containing protein [Vibrio sp. SCSIO 43137]|uniref:DUF3307 domain-containing protein n=1 Tax=Vibrio sp. SCSIO 43137 TaxID=3021011 RepID=UPI0023077660|nr:DUF3307 domain-containing protein [Vibrio sp. SCSIO 43137]WCE32523.1 DUF3307 domain-containing protein [Vibrio sp. SCSIO 43137]